MASVLSMSRDSGHGEGAAVNSDREELSLLLSPIGGRTSGVTASPNFHVLVPVMCFVTR